jgi:hypothetical protein
MLRHTTGMYGGIYVRIYMYAQKQYMRTFMHKKAVVCVRACMYANVMLHLCIFVCTQMYACRYAWMYACKCKNIYIYIYIYIIM